MSRLINKVLVSQPKPSNSKSPYFQLMDETGITIDFKQLFSIKPVASREFRDQKIDILKHTSVVLSSRTMADHFFALLKELRIELPDDFRYYCSSEIIATYLQKYIVVRKRKVFFPEKTGGAPSLSSLLIKYSSKELYFIPSIEGQKEHLFEELNANGVTYTQGIISQLQFTKITKEEIQSYDLLLFFSPNGVQSLYTNIPDYTQGDQSIACLGEGTLKALQERSLKVDIAVPNKDFTSINAALEYLVKTSHKKQA